MWPIVPLTPALNRLTHRIELNADRVLDDLPIAAGHRYCDWNATFARGGEHPTISFRQAFGSDLETTESIAFVRICTRQIEDELRHRTRMPFPKSVERA